MPNLSGCPATSPQGQFHVLTAPEWIEVTKTLRRSPAALHVLYYLKTLDPSGQSELDIGVRELAAALEYSPGTVSKALKLLEQKRFITLDLISARVRIRPLISSDEKIFPVGNECFLQETPVSHRKHFLMGDKCADCAENDTQQGFVPTCGKLDVVPITRSDLVLKETIGTTYLGNEQGDTLVQPQSPCGEADPPIHPEVEPNEPLPGYGTTNTDLLIERLVMHGIPLNKSVLGILTTLKRTHPPAAVEKIVENALSSMREQGNTIRNPGGFFVTAVRRGFTANGEKRRHREEVKAIAAAEAVHIVVDPPSESQAEALPAPKKEPDWIRFSMAIDQALLHGNPTFGLLRLQEAWAEGWHDRVEELVMLRKRDWPFIITATGVAYIGD